MAGAGGIWLIVAVAGFAPAPEAVVGLRQLESLTNGNVATASLAEYARQLDDPRLDIRESATQRLIDDDAISTEELVDFVDSRWSSLPPEAIERFLHASRQRYIANPGAIGIQFSNAPITTIDTVIAGTPAADVLQPGDQFLSLNDQPLPASNAEQRPQLLRIMAGLKAGDVVTARILRDREELEVQFALADPRGLPRFEDFIQQMQREMLQQWTIMREQRFPPNRQVLVDMEMDGLRNLEAPGGATPSGRSASALIDALGRQRVEVSQSIARVMEQSSAMDNPQRRRELEAEYLALIDRFAQLNARTRLLEAAASGRRRR